MSMLICLYGGGGGWKFLKIISTSKKLKETNSKIICFIIKQKIQY